MHIVLLISWIIDAHSVADIMDIDAHSVAYIMGQRCT